MSIKIDNQIEETIRKLNDDIDRLTKNELESITYDICHGAQMNFDRFMPEVAADDPFVYCETVYVNQDTREVVCWGDQVLFIEFGAGVLNEVRRDVKPTEIVGWHGEHIGWKERGDIPAFGFQFIDNYLTEVAPRPDGIVPLGEYGKGLGSNDYWIYYGWRESNNSQEFLKRKGKGLMITRGNPPARALYRAIRNAIRRRTR